MASKASLNSLICSPFEESVWLAKFPSCSVVLPCLECLWNQQGKLCTRKSKGLRREGLLGCSGDWTWRCQGKYWLRVSDQRQTWLSLDCSSQRQSRRKAGAPLAPCVARRAACAQVSSLPDQTMAGVWQQRSGCQSDQMPGLSEGTVIGRRTRHPVGVNTQRWGSLRPQTL